MEHWTIRGCMRCLSAIVWPLLVGHNSAAQSGTQFWAEFQTSYPFANRYLVENTVAYQTLLSGGEKWSTLSLSPTFEMVLTPKIELTAEVPLGWTRQNNTRTSFEVSPLAGFRFHITQNRRIDTRLLARVQSRNVHQIESDVWEHLGRLRLKGEVWISITGPNLFTDKLLYSLIDYEEFLVTDQQINERFANLRRARVGLGYRFSYAHRLDLYYTLQYSRDEINGDFSRIDNVIQVKYKLYLNPAPSTESR